MAIFSAKAKGWQSNPDTNRAQTWRKQNESGMFKSTDQFEGKEIWLRPQIGKKTWNCIAYITALRVHVPVIQIWTVDPEFQDGEH